MRRVLGIEVPDSVVSVQVRAHFSRRGRPRVIFTGEVDGLEQQTIIDAVSLDRSFWGWVSSQIHNGKITGHDQSDTCVIVKVSVGFLNQDGNYAVIDPATGQTSFGFPEPWEFTKGDLPRTEQESIVSVVDRQSIPSRMSPKLPILRESDPRKSEARQNPRKLYAAQA